MENSSTNLPTNTIEELFDLMSLESDDKRLDYIRQGKTNGNNLVKQGKWEEALMEYTKIRNSVEKTENLQKLLENEEIKKEYKLIISNMALCLSKLGRFKESVQCDIKIIQKLDKLFDKSYARLIMSYLAQNNFTMANYFASLLRHYFSESTQNMYKDITENLEKERKKHNKDIGALLSGAMSGSN
jgi:tetratricopeptide (TPR) repeat protein